MPFNVLQPENRRSFHTALYLAFRQRGQVQEINVQVIGAIANPYIWLDDLNFGARFGPRGTLIEQQLEAGVDPANINLPNDHLNPTGCTFVSGLSVANPADPVWQAPLALALGMTAGGGGTGRFMVEQGTDDRIWLGHRGYLGGGGVGRIGWTEFHNLLPELQQFLKNNPQHLGLVPGLEHVFGQVFAHIFAPDDLVRPQQQKQRVFPIAAFRAEDFFQRLASYVHQCHILRVLRVNGTI
jgi:hypothetical protein